MANGLDEKRVVGFRAARAGDQSRRRPRHSRLLAASSATSCATARWTWRNDALAELDFVIGSVHSHMNLEAAEMTDRLLRALECPHLRILGHPTGRMLLHRDPYPFDFERVVAEAVRRGVWLEINASPERLDLHGALIRSARRPRARSSPSLPTRIIPSTWRNMRYGVVTARRGWLGAGDIMNTLPAGRVCESASKQNHENHIHRKQVYDCGLFRVTEDRAVGSEDRIRDQAHRGAPHRSAP